MLFRSVIHHDDDNGQTQSVASKVNLKTVPVSHKVFILKSRGMHVTFVWPSVLAVAGASM